MSDDLKIPLLDNLVSKGQLEQEPEHPVSFDENSALEIEPDSDEVVEVEAETEGENSSNEIPEELSNDTSVQELLIDEEIRMILDKHMDNAYEEIIRLLNHKIS